MFTSRLFWTWFLMAVIGGSTAAMAYLGQQGWWGLFSGVSVVLIVAMITQDIVQNRARPWLRMELVLGLRTAHQLFGWNDEVRMCVFVPCTFRRKHLRQLTPYTLSGKWSSMSRGLSVKNGVVGYTFRTGELFAQVLKPDEDFAEKMRRSWGFTDEEIDGMRKDRRAFLAVPVLDRDGKAKAVLYCDTSKPINFTRIKQKVLEAALLKVAVELARVL